MNKKLLQQACVDHLSGYAVARGSSAPMKSPSAISAAVRAGDAKPPNRIGSARSLPHDFSLISVSAMRSIVSAVVMLAAAAVPAHAGCVDTRISALGSRLDGMPDSGSSVTYENGGYGVSYDVLPQLRGSRIGDPVHVCLVKACPKRPDGYYAARNIRTGKSWTLPSDVHLCDG